MVEDLATKIYSLITSTIKEHANELRRKYGIYDITVEVDTSSNDDPYMLLKDEQGNEYDDVDFTRTYGEVNAIKEIALAAKILSLLTCDDEVKLYGDGVTTTITFI